MQRRHLALLPAGILATPAIAQEAERSQDLVQGFSRARLARFQPAMAREVERGSFNGCVALIARNGQIIHHEAYGHQDNARRIPMTREAIFLLASMTKPITSVAAMMLVEEGRMKIGDNITQWLPELRELKVMTREGEVPLARPITVQDLLRHSSGFVYAAASPFPRIRELYEENDIEARRGPVPGDEMLRRLGTIPLAFQPGAQFFYSISTDVLGLLLQRVAGQPLDRLIAERITGPLGMTDTVWWVDPARRSRVAESIASDPLSTPMWNSYRIEQNPVPAGHFKGGAGLVGTSSDYFRFAQMVANGGSFEGKRYLSAPTVNWMLSDHMGSMGGTPQASTGPGYGFGLGFAVRREQGIAVAPGSPGDAMWAGAWGTSFTIDRAEKLVGVFMAQGPSSRTHTRMVFKNMVYGAMVESLRG
ncbi:beta-lactamase family protein [Roseococcus sp. SDR]|uniref:serine hydrolase domain-containing protein n=1 Tax=Roseococcus sp. SDR TaxID=2835532 RepID=UPI001BCE254C|nr:serine hydrolase domain-containing protein [Roseococcus sp. SDR]MBS7788669.1 serine hydrolase [Roseococcus sp. SDR]MBV1843983.1 beta-lactamase family protein [Roseococcus sp. SDR]